MLDVKVPALLTLLLHQSSALRLSDIKFRDRQQILGEALSVFVGTDVLEIWQVTNRDNFPGWLTLPRIDESTEGVLSVVQDSMVLSGCWIVLGAALMNIYARQLPYRSSSLIFDMTNQQFLGVCNVVLVGVLLSIVASNEPLDLSLVFLKLIASYGAILGFRLYYTDSLRL